MVGMRSMCVHVPQCKQIFRGIDLKWVWYDVLKQLLVLVGQMSVGYQTQHKQDTVIGST